MEFEEEEEGLPEEVDDPSPNPPEEEGLDNSPKKDEAADEGGDEEPNIIAAAETEAEEEKKEEEKEEEQEEAAVAAPVVADAEPIQSSKQRRASSRKKEKKSSSHRRKKTDAEENGVEESASDEKLRPKKKREKRSKRKEADENENDGEDAVEEIELSHSNGVVANSHSQNGVDVSPSEEQTMNTMIKEMQEREMQKLKAKLEAEAGEGSSGKEGTKMKKEDAAGAAKPAENRINYFKLFKYADMLDVILITVGTIGSFAHGVLMPLFSYFFGHMINSFGPGSNILDEVTKLAYYFIILAVVGFVTAYLQIACFMLSAQRQSDRVRHLYFTSVLRQDMAWYDTKKSGELTSRMAGDILKFQEGISEKVGSFLQYFTMFVGGFIVGFVGSWKLSLVILSIVPLLAISGAVMSKLIASFSSQGQSSYAEAGGVADEVISCVRTVAAFGGEEFEKARYGRLLDKALLQGIRKSHISGVGMGITMFIMFGSYALAFWYGSTLVEHGELKAGDVVTVFFAIVMGAMGIGQAAPNLTAFAEATGAGYELFSVIEHPPKIDPMSDEGYKPKTMNGKIEFKNVKFNYPTRPDITVLKGISFSLQPGKILALVGESGCGKSTTVSLVQRFYDIEEGEILIDGRNVKEYNVRELRRNIGVVSQEPILFDKTIAENIRYGRLDVTKEEMDAACKAANAYNFIMELPDKYDTLCGERGVQLSGGQKQRIAIARAIVRNPKILLLDEATSALDTQSEKVVQEALDKATEGRTTIVIAHRLSTIRNADAIAVVQKGNIVEMGTHEELMHIKAGWYKAMVKLQSTSKKDSDKKQGAKSKAESEGKKNAITEAGRKASDPGSKDVVVMDEKKKKALLGKSGVLLRTYRLNSPEWFFVVFGAIGAALNGVLFPVFSLVLSDVTSDMLQIDIDPEGYRSKINFWCIIFGVIGVCALIGGYLQTGFYGIGGERLTDRMRRMLFSAIVRQDIGFFDNPENGTGVLATQLATDATEVQGLTGVRLGNYMQIITTMAAALIIGFTGCWRLAFVVLACLPLLAASSSLQVKLITGFNTKAKVYYEKSGQIATRATENIRTVASLGREEEFMKDFFEALRVPNRESYRNTQISGASFGFSEFANFLIFALGFWYGAKLVTNGDCDFAGMMTALTAILFGAMMLGQIASFTPDYVKGKIAAASIFTLFDRVPIIDSSNHGGQKLDKVRGHVRFEKVSFSYPMRPDVKVLKQMSFEAKPGQTVAIVGSSGCGKSTIVSLLQRFYLPGEGKILLDGAEISELNLRWYRSNFGIVSQEPVLFATSIRDNIAYGLQDEEVSDEQIIAAAKAANVHDFISSLPDGYKTEVGEKGVQLSGGQKQRVAIARATIRNPKILLLDEATSALDSESEKIVQDALDRVRLGRTTIVIAHRLSTIQGSDLIIVLGGGQIVEAGNHAELMALRGQYHAMVQNQAII